MRQLHHAGLEVLRRLRDTRKGQFFHFAIRREPFGQVAQMTRKDRVIVDSFLILQDAPKGGLI